MDFFFGELNTRSRDSEGVEVGKWFRRLIVGSSSGKSAQVEDDDGGWSEKTQGGGCVCYVDN